MLCKYPKNIHDYFSDGRDKEFAIWAFGCEQPGLRGGVSECWNKLHPENPMTEGETIFLCICKMNYLYQHQKFVTPPPGTVTTLKE